jgi:hypothetical protein
MGLHKKDELTVMMGTTLIVETKFIVDTTLIASKTLIPRTKNHKTKTNIDNLNDFEMKIDSKVNMMVTLRPQDGKNGR